MTGADIRKVWTPTAENFFRRVSADYLDALLLDLSGCDPHGSGFKTWKAQKKGEKAAAMERLFRDADYQAAWKIDAGKKAVIEAWVPDCLWPERDAGGAANPPGPSLEKWRDHDA